MWHDEAWCIDDLVVVQDQIQVEGTRRARIRALAAELFLDIEQEHEKFAEEFVSTMKVLRKFTEVSETQTPFLLRKAQRIEEYLGQR